jgi:hypothetical protein
MPARALKASARGEPFVQPAQSRRRCQASAPERPAVHWPIQIRLVQLRALLENASLVVAADCVPVAMPGSAKNSWMATRS